MFGALKPRLAAALGLVLGLAGCSDDSTVTDPTGEMDETGRPNDGSDSTESTADGSDNGSTDDSESGDGDGDSGEETGDESGETGDEGGEPEPILPRSSMDLASAAVVTYSTNYTMVLVMGQSTSNIGSMSSPTYRLDGGTVRISGSPP